MKFFHALAAACFVSHAACADNFTARMEAGRTAAASAAGTAVGESVNPVLAEIAYACDPPRTILPAADLGPLDIVGDITRQSHLINLEARPQNPLAACYLSHLATHYFFPPHWVGNYPLYIHLVVSN